MIERMPVSIEDKMEILELERVISHMEVDLSYHQSQTRFFEKKIMDDQDTLERLHRKSHPQFQHSPYDDSHHDEGKDHEM